MGDAELEPDNEGATDTESDDGLSAAQDDADENFSDQVAGDTVQSCGDAPPTPVPVSPQKKAWIAIEMVDAEGKPVQGEDYRITLPDGSVVEGSLDTRGRAKIEGIDPGSCKITFPNLDRESWQPQ